MTNPVPKPPVQALMAEIEDCDRILTFMVRKMPPLQLERWVCRVGHILSGNRVKPGFDYFESLAKLAKRQFLTLALAPGTCPDELKALGDELLSCCTHLDGTETKLCTPEYLDDLLGSVVTVFLLLRVALKLNLDFLEHLGAGPIRNASPEPNPQTGADQ